jgi:tRNA-splicing ligase RtcB
MPYELLPGTRAPVKSWAPIAEVEQQALQQLRSVADLPWVDAVAVMPDVHWGNGASVGSVIVNRDAVSPAVVGVDIGCGMMAVRTTIKPNDLTNLRELRHSIERSVPVGFGENKNVTDRMVFRVADCGFLSEVGQKFHDKAHAQMGTLGGGNHFIEICVGDDDRVWVMLHSGSRGTGNQLARVHMETAKGLMADLVKRYGVSFDKELAALAVGTPEYEAYMHDLYWCQRYARQNREEMMMRVLKDLSYHMWKENRHVANWTDLTVNCHHNYIEETQVDGRPALVTRKGAVSAKSGEFGIIPGSMGSKSYIVKGRGNSDAYCSCSHGAGRRMSRGAAKRMFKQEDLAQQTEGVECRKDEGVIDEIPGAYKEIDVVIAQQADLVEVVAVLKQVVCIKG